MHKENKSAKTIVKEINDKAFEFVPNVSLGIFHLGYQIKEYLNLEYTHDILSMEQYDLPDIDSYYFPKHGVEISINDQHQIEYITCRTVCIWNGKNIIGMLLRDFLKQYNLHPIDEEGSLFYLEEPRHTQRAYDFKEDVGLQVWVWRKHIVTVIISNDKL